MKRSPEDSLVDTRQRSKQLNGSRGETPSDLLRLFENLKAAGSSTADLEKAFFEGVPQVPASGWDQFAFYDLERYSRNLLAAQEHFSLILLCWEPGQHTPVHSHRDGCAQGLTSMGYVLQGELLLSEYSEDRDDSGARTVEAVTMLTASKNPRMMEHSRAPRGQHVLENINKTRRALSVHLYTPAFLDCCWKDKANTLQSIPVCYAPISHNAISASLRNTGLMGVFYTSFDKLASIVSEELRRGKDLDRMMRIFESLRFNPKEFRRYAHWSSGKYTRNLIGYNASFTLLMLCWDRGQESPIHDHAGSHCFMKILEGELHEVRYDATNPSKLRVKGITHLRDEGVAYIDDTQGVHKMVNPNPSHGAISLHIYIPPYKRCSLFNVIDGTTKEISMVAANTLDAKPFTSLDLGGNQPVPITSVTLLVDELTALFDGSAADNLHTDGQAAAAILNRVHFVASEWDEHVHFSEHNYTRMLLTLHKRFSLVLLCWNPRQQCPRHSHDHSPDNMMVVKTLAGEILFQRFADASDPRERDTIALPVDSPSLVLSNRDLGFHETRNSSSQHCALSLHLYTPPMLECVHTEGVAPIVYGSKCAGVSAPSLHVAQEPTSSVLSVSKLSPATSIFSNFQTLMEMLLRIFEAEPGTYTPSALDASVTEVLERFEFNPKEVEQYKSMSLTGYTKRRLVLHPSFEVFIICWRAGQTTPIHDHGGALSWNKVLEGEQRDTRFSRPAPGQPPYMLNAFTLKRGEVNSLDASVIHQTMALNADLCTLTVYSPPYDHFSCYCATTGAESLVHVSSLHSHSEKK